MKNIILPAIGAMALAAAVIPSFASADYIAVFGGPGTTPDGGVLVGVNVPLHPGAAVNDAGTVLAYADKRDGAGRSMGTRAIRWDASGVAVELGNLGTISTPFLHTTDTHPYAINGSGTAVGRADKYDGLGMNLGQRAVRWDATGIAATELGNLGTAPDGSTVSEAYAISAAGTAVGYARKYDASGANKGERAVRWDAGGTTATELENLGTDRNGLTMSRAYGVNAAGTAVGYAQKYGNSGFSSLGEVAVRWGPSGSATELGGLGTDFTGAQFSRALAVNSAGTAVGYLQKYDSFGRFLGHRAARWDASGTAPTELGTLGTNPDGAAESEPYAINDAGITVGYAFKYDSVGVELGPRAVRWDASGHVVELGNLVSDIEGTRADAYAINDAGIVVGSATSAFGQSAVLWGPDGKPVDLNTLLDPASGWTLQNAFAISNAGWVTGTGFFDPDGPGPLPAYDRLFLIQVPEPTSLAVLSLASVGLLRRRRAA
jgi:hypothetical protein